MSKKRHEYSQSLILKEMMEDAVHSDMLVINSIQKLSKEQQYLALSDAFFLSSKLTKRIIEQQLYIALLEAATMVNKDCKSICQVESLRSICKDKKDHEIIEMHVEKYEIYIALFASKINFFKQPLIHRSLSTSRRNAKAIRYVLEEQIEEAALKLNSEQRPELKSAALSIKKYYLKESLNDINSIYQNLVCKRWYSGVKVLLELAKNSCMDVCNFSQNDIEYIFEQVNEIKGKELV